MFSHQAKWHDIRQADCLFLQRPCTKQEMEMAQVAREFGVPVWVDWDDQIFAITPDNSAKSVYSDTETKGYIASTMQMASVITVSTKKLQEEFSRFGTCELIPNCYDDHLNRYKQETKRSSVPQILYRGTVTHQRDLGMVDEAILRIDNELEKVVWFFMGMEAWSVEQLKAKVFIPPCDVFKYFEILGAMNVDLGIVPLHDSLFNRCKSNIAAMEIAYAGGVPIVPDWPEWDIPGVLKYKTIEEFENLVKFAAGNEDLAKLHEGCWKYFQGELNLNKWNNKRLRILNNLEGY